MIGFQKNISKLVLLATLPHLVSCIDEFEASTESFKDLLVVDALVTDEEKRHRVILSRAFRFGEEPRSESNANVKIVGESGTEFHFEETENGVYLSQSPFAAQNDGIYSLHITTFDGFNFRSDPVAIPPKVDINNLRAERLVNDLGKDGVGIFLDNSSDALEPTYFRYDFEETYKIIAPKYEPFRLKVVRNDPCFPNPFQVDIEPWQDERRVCYSSRNSQRLIQVSSTELVNNTIENFQVQFVDAENYIISHRYSILVTQYSQTQDAFSFYQRLGDFSSADDIFSAIQPGFLEGNIRDDSNSQENVLGYFEVASVSTERTYFNYSDLFPEEELPPYAINCGTFSNPRLIPRGYHCAAPGVCDGNCSSPLIGQILAELVTFAGEKGDDLLSPYYTWPSPCGDCTKIGSNVVPEFWEE